ncbi:hypothetical protein AB0M39_00010 [Streptomyces sp. NPDC051907]|uniref:hypothetical protein n=1 Tax=Streptomyces sp. NPDC051907 TaxID=3155284 RepID=UPI0034419192
MPLISHETRDYAILLMYAVPDDAWYVELYEGAKETMLALAIVPDEDPEREPTVSFYEPAGRRAVPYDVIRWFMDHVDAEIRSSRGWMELRPELVALIRRLRELRLDGVVEDGLPALVALLRETVPPADLDVVLEAAFEAPIADFDELGEPTGEQIRGLRARMAEWGWTDPVERTSDQ